MARLRARTYAYLIGIGTPMLLAGVLWWFRRQGGQAAPSDQLFALVIGAAMLGTTGILLRRSLPTLAASLALLVLGFPQEILGSVILPSGGLYLIAAFIVGLTDVGEMVGEGIEAGKEGMEESGMKAPEMPSAFQDATDGGEAETADAPQHARPEAESLDPPEQPVPDAEAPEGPVQPVDADDVEPITTEDGVDVADDDETPDPDEIVEEHGPHHAPEVQVDQDRIHADDPSVGQIGDDESTDDEPDTEDETAPGDDVSTETDETDADETTETDADETTETDADETTETDADDATPETGAPEDPQADVDSPDDPADAEDTGPADSDPVETDDDEPDTADESTAADETADAEADTDDETEKTDSDDESTDADTTTDETSDETDTDDTERSA